MIKLNRTNSDNRDFRHLTVLLDKELEERYGEEQSFYSQFNKLDMIQHVVVAYNNTTPVGCGALKSWKDNIAEIKRMYVDVVSRRQGIAASILQELESWAKELNFSACLLETGKKQPEAIRLYQTKGYTFIPNYGQYQNVESSVCMKKIFELV